MENCQVFLAHSVPLKDERNEIIYNFDESVHFL